MKKSLISMLVAGTMIIATFAGCSDSEEAKTGNGKKVAISLPTDVSNRWSNDGAIMTDKLESLGYEVDLRYAQGDVQEQIKQIQEMLEDGAKCLVVAAVDEKSLAEPLNQAKDAGIPIIAYDNLIVGTDAVSYYLSYDNRAIGGIIANYVVDNEALSSDDPKTIEFFMGSPGDNGAKMLYEGMMEVIRPYLKDGSLECKSGQTDFSDACTEQWNPKHALSRCEDIIKTYYKKAKLDICVSAYDGLSYGCIGALENSGYTFMDWPMITGQDAEGKAIDYIVTGKQSMTIYKDSSLLAEQCVSAVSSIMQGQTPEINDTESIDNGEKKIPAYLLTPVVVDAKNYKDILNIEEATSSETE